MIATPPPAPAPVPLERLLSYSWALFKRNWIVALPPVIAFLIIGAAFAALVGGFVVALLTHGVGHGASRLIGPSLAGIFGFVVLTVVVGVWAQAAMFGMADAAWAKGTATFGDGFAAFTSRGGSLILAVIGIFGLVLAALILALPTLGLSILALPLFTMYVLPSVVTGGRDGFTAIGESFRLVVRFFGSSAIVLLVLLGIQYGISLLASAPFYMMQPSGGDGVPHLPALLCIPHCMLSAS